MEHSHYVLLLAPVANAFAGTVTTSPVNMSSYKRCVFEVVKGVGTSGTSTITVEACDDTSASNTSALPFMYRLVSSTDTEGTLTAATTAGFTTTAGSAQIYEIEVDDLAMGASGYKFLRLKAVEVVASAVLGGIVARMSGARFTQASKPTVMS